MKGKVKIIKNRGEKVETITASKLMEMVEEELDLLQCVNAHHDSKGRWSSKANAKVYSLTRNAVDDVGQDGELEAPKRGRVTGKGKVSSLYGMNTGPDETQCGRLNIKGKKKVKKRSCGSYPDEYLEEDEESGKETKKRNRFKNRDDAIPRSEDSPSVRREKIFPGSQPLYSLSKGIYEDVEDVEDVEEVEKSVEINSPADDAYLKALIASEIKAYFNTTGLSVGSGAHCSWEQIMTAYKDIETAKKGHKEPKEPAG